MRPSIWDCGCPQPHAANPGLVRRRANAGPPKRTRPLFGLAPGGVWPAGMSPHRWCALTAPFHPCPPHGGRYVSVPLSVGSPRLGVTQRPALWSSDFPQPPPGDRGRSAHSTYIVAHWTVEHVSQTPNIHRHTQLGASAARGRARVSSRKSQSPGGRQLVPADWQPEFPRVDDAGRRLGRCALEERNDIVARPDRMS